MSMRKIEDFAALSVIGVDIGKDVFHLVGFDAAVLSEQKLVPVLSRPPALAQGQFFLVCLTTVKHATVTSAEIPVSNLTGPV